MLRLAAPTRVTIVPVAMVNGIIREAVIGMS